MHGRDGKQAVQSLETRLEFFCYGGAGWSGRSYLIALGLGLLNCQQR